MGDCTNSLKFHTQKKNKKKLQQWPVKHFELIFTPHIALFSLIISLLVLDGMLLFVIVKIKNARWFAMSKVDENIRHCTIFSCFILRLLGGMICFFVTVKMKNTWWFAMSKVDETIRHCAVFCCFILPLLDGTIFVVGNSQNEKHSMICNDKSWRKHQNRLTSPPQWNGSISEKQCFKSLGP